MASMSDINVLITIPFSEPLVERLRAVAPQVQIHVHPAKKAEDLPEELLLEIEVLYTISALPDLEMAPKLRWIQFHFAGVDHVADHSLLRSGLQVTTLSGAAVPQIAEFALMCILAQSRHLSAMMTDPADVRWGENHFKRYQPRELRGSMVGIVGYGSVGREIARLCHAFGASVLATKRDLKRLDDTGYTLNGLGDPGAELPERLYPPQALSSMASSCDFIVITVPLTPQTRGMIDERVFGGMKPTAYLIDVSRGGVVDHGALVEALNEKRLAGAALDVYPIEPLPESSPLWGMPNVILSPHVAGTSEHYYERAAELFAENLHRYHVGRPLLNLYDPDRNY
ncbi:MAG: D-2-hydroxyacid dehydrogenase [Anaerolineales bacterium]|nr:MAG: D-2-hydroxyacid dehydrogenase [Anaerolineales bacterium]